MPHISYLSLSSIGDFLPGQSFLEEGLMVRGVQLHAGLAAGHQGPGRQRGSSGPLLQLVCIAAGRLQAYP